MRVTFILNSLKSGGAELQTFDLANALLQRHHSVQVIPLTAEAEINVLPELTTPPCGNGLFDRRSRALLAHHINMFQPDVVVAVNGRPAACIHQAKLFGLVRNVPVVTIYHTTALSTLRQFINYLVHLPAIRSSDALVFVSENQRRYCNARFLSADRMCVIHNGVDPLRFNQKKKHDHRIGMRKALGLSPDLFVIGQSAALRPEKNHSQALDALADLKRQGLKAALLLVGDGPERYAIERRAIELNIAGEVILVGRQIDVVPWLAAFDVGILTSKAIETFSLSALEIMSMGIPVVLSDIGGADELVTDGQDGFLFPVNNTPDLVSALKKLIDAQHREQIGRAAAEKVSNFDRAKMIESYEKLFAGLIRDAPIH